MQVHMLEYLKFGQLKSEKNLILFYSNRNFDERIISCHCHQNSVHSHSVFQVRDSHTQEIKANLSSPVVRFAVTGLEPGAQYQAGLFSYNTKGRSEPVILQAATLRLPEKQLTQEKGEKFVTDGQVKVKKLWYNFKLATAFCLTKVHLHVSFPEVI